MSDRRFSEEEVAEILARATRPEAGTGGPHPVPSDSPSTSPAGFTPAELQEIGREAGIPPRRMAEAARVVDSSRSPVAGRTFLGTPRIQAQDSATRTGLQVGGGLALLGLLFVAITLLTGVDPSAAWVGRLVTSIGIGVGASGVLVLPRWAQRRAAQIEEAAKGAELALGE